MAGSPADAISQAVERTKQLLFPFKAEKWFALGFTVFLAQCGEGGGGSFNLPMNFPSGSAPSPSGGSGGFAKEAQQFLEEAVRAFEADAAFYIALAAGGLLVSLGAWLVVLWFSSRAKLMFVESLVWDRVDVSQQWTRAGELGFSLFKFRALLSAVGWLLGLGIVAAAVVVGIPSFLAGNFWGPRAWASYATFGLGTLIVGVPLAIVSALLDDFVAPLMVVRNLRVRPAWQACRAEVLAGHVGGLILFYILRAVLATGVALVAGVLTCLTCCLVTVPYLGTVILLPAFVCSRAYALCYLEQLGVPVFPAPEPSWAAYDQWRFPR
jgi:hypothetical protein